MMNTRKLLTAAGMTALAAGLGAGPAHAAGTVAGQTITNTVTVNFTVGGISQTAQTGTNAVTVDRKVVVTVTGAATTTTASPGQIDAVTATATDASSTCRIAIRQPGSSAVWPNIVTLPTTRDSVT